MRSLFNGMPPGLMVMVVIVEHATVNTIRIHRTAGFGNCRKMRPRQQAEGKVSDWKISHDVHKAELLRYNGLVRPMVTIRDDLEKYMCWSE